MSNPFLALDLSDDENITIVKPAEPKPEKKTQHTTHPRGPDAKTHQPRKELKKEEEDLMQKKKHPEGGRRGGVPQPDVATPHERAKMGLKKEEHVQTQKKPFEGRGRQFDRHTGTGRGREIKKGGAGGHNWGKAGDEAAAPLPEKTPEPTDEAKEETPAPVVEEDPSLTLEEFEKLRAQKRSGALFEPKVVRQVVAEPAGVAYKRDETVGEGDYIKLGAEEHDLKKKPGHFKHKEKKVFEIDYKVRDTSVPDAPRGGRGAPREGGRGSRPPREDGGAPRGRGAPRARGGSARGGAPAAGRIDTADQSAFPKLGGA